MSIYYNEIRICADIANEQWAGPTLLLENFETQINEGVGGLMTLLPSPYTGRTDDIDSRFEVFRETGFTTESQWCTYHWGTPRPMTLNSCELRTTDDGDELIIKGDTQDSPPHRLVENLAKNYLLDIEHFWLSDADELIGFTSISKDYTDTIALINDLLVVRRDIETFCLDNFDPDEEGAGLIYKMIIEGKWDALATSAWSQPFQRLT